MALLANFTATDGTVLTDYTSDSGHTFSNLSGSGAIASNRLYGVSNPSRFVSDWVPATADYDVTGVGRRVTATSATFYVMGRVVDVSNRYYAGWNGSAWIIGKVASGSTSTIGTGTTIVPTVGQDYTLKLEMRGDQLKLYVDGVQDVSVTDASLTAKGSAGMSLGGSTSTTGSHFDSISATDAGGASSQELTPSLFTNSQTFHAPAVTATYALAPALVTNTQTFFAPTVSGGGGGGGTVHRNGGFGSMGLVMGIG